MGGRVKVRPVCLALVVVVVVLDMLPPVVGLVELHPFALDVPVESVDVLDLRYVLVELVLMRLRPLRGIVEWFCSHQPPSTSGLRRL